MFHPTSVVMTEAGPVQGIQKQLQNSDLPINCFLGIPYAAPPVGERRWKSPQPFENWRETRNCFDFAADFPQAVNPLFRAPNQSEDCLYLNVWAPVTSNTQKLPVMVWIHGGGFVGGSGSDQRSDGTRMASEGVVVVSFNYRSGVFGFLAHPELSAESDDSVSGNYGLQDQIAALKWIQKNINHFGGDANKVTVFGVSAGSASISLLLTCPQANGLFHQSILHSPGAARPLATLAQAEALSVKELGLDIKRLRALDEKEVLKFTSLMNPKIRGLTTPRILRPIMDGVYLSENERDVFKGHRQSLLPMIVGSNLDEGSLLTKDWTIQSMDDYVELIKSNFKAFSAEAFSLYPADSKEDVRRCVAELFGDTQFNYGTRLLAQSNSNQVAKTWRYLFAKRRPSQLDGPHHGQEVAHVFGNLSAKVTSLENDFDSQDEVISNAMLSYWVRFAYTGDPNQSERPEWPAYDVTLGSMIVFGNEISRQDGFRDQNLDFIDRYFDANNDPRTTSE
jgi:carboxylesterase type B